MASLDELLQAWIDARTPNAEHRALFEALVTVVDTLSPVTDQVRELTDQVRELAGRVEALERLIPAAPLRPFAYQGDAPDQGFYEPASS